MYRPPICKFAFGVHYSSPSSLHPWLPFQRSCDERIVYLERRKQLSANIGQQALKLRPASTTSVTRESIRGVHCIWIKVNCGLVSDLIP